MEDCALKRQAFDSKHLALVFFEKMFGDDSDKRLVYDDKYSSGKKTRYTCAGVSLPLDVPLVTCGTM